MPISHDPSTTWKDITARKLVSCEALIELLDKIHAVEEIVGLSSTIAKEWKYIANVAAWRLTLANENGLRIIDGYRGEAHVSETPVPSPWDDLHLRSQLPLRLGADALTEAPPPPEHLITKSVSEIIVMPMIRDGLCIGVLSVAANHEPLTEIEMRYVRILGNHFADKVYGILRRQHHLDELLSRATLDALTGILNRGASMERFRILHQISRRTSEPISIMMLDVDRFKNINDSFGHLAGDRILSEIGNRLQKQTRESDVIGRYGGEEFISVLYPCGIETVRTVAERFRESISQEPFRIDGIPDLNVTISIGTSTVIDAADSIESMLKRADEALYRSKNDGRNRVSIG